MKQIEQQRLLIDTDMGNDDIMAICMILLNPRFKVEGFTVTSGVSDAQIGTKNLLGILTYCTKDIPVAMGPKRSFQTQLNFPQIDMQRAQELTLLADRGININPALSEPLPYADLIEQVIQKPFTILALGPLTNIATLIQQYPQTKDKVERIILMGGGIKQGNMLPELTTEYNIALDPQSAAQVFSSGIKITLVGVDATSQSPATLEFKNKLSKIKPQTKEAKIIQAIVLENNGDFNAFYDPLAAAILADLSVVTKSTTGTISVAQTGLNQGQTSLQQRPEGNVNAVLDCDSQKFYDQVLELIGKGSVAFYANLKGGEKYVTRN